MPTAPNTANLTLHGGVVSFQKNSTGSFRDLGECDTFELNLADDEKLEYLSNRTGARRVVKTVITKKSASINLRMMEIIGPNIAMAVGGTEVVNTDGTKTIGIKTNGSTTGVLRITGAVDDGNAVDWEGTVDINPSGTLNFFSAGEFMGLDVVADISADEDGAFGYITIDDGDASD